MQWTLLVVFSNNNVYTIFQVSKKRAAELMLDRLKQLPPVASALVPKPRKVVTSKKKSRNLIKVRRSCDWSRQIT